MIQRKCARNKNHRSFYVIFWPRTKENGWRIDFNSISLRYCRHFEDGAVRKDRRHAPVFCTYMYIYYTHTYIRTLMWMCVIVCSNVCVCVCPFYNSISLQMTVFHLRYRPIPKNQPKRRSKKFILILNQSKCCSVIESLSFSLYIYVYVIYT